MAITVTSNKDNNLAASDKEFERAMFNQAIPGQSLTKMPGGAAYERPPQFVDVDEAAEDIWNYLKKPKVAIEMVESMKQGAPIEMLTNSMLMSGFMNGKITADMTHMLKPIVARQMATIAKMRGVEPKVTFDRTSTAEMVSRTEMDRMIEEDPFGADFTRGLELAEEEEEEFNAPREFQGILASKPEVPTEEEEDIFPPRRPDIGMEADITTQLRPIDETDEDI
jgi:hypothetical protein